MAVFTFSVFIKRSSQDVFDLLTKPGSCQWIPPMYPQHGHPENEVVLVQLAEAQSR